MIFEHLFEGVFNCIGFGDYGENYVRIALIENNNRIRQAARNIKKFLKQFDNKKKLESKKLESKKW
jgi:alanine-synthesizing transaminase